MIRIDGERTPAFKLLITILIGAALAIPIFMVWFLVYDRESQSRQAQASITAGWGGPQAIAGPVLAIPYRATASETVIENGQSVTRSRDVIRELTLAPEVVQLTTAISPERRQRSIYEAVVYDSRVSGQARFALPPDLERFGLTQADLQLDRAELRFSLSDPRGLGANPRVTAFGRPLRLQPGGGSNGGRGFFAFLDSAQLAGGAIPVSFAYDFRGNGALGLAPQAGDTRWTVTSRWPHPSFGGSFLPATRRVDEKGFSASYRIGNLALGRALVTTGTPGAVSEPPPPSTRTEPPPPPAMADRGPVQTAEISLIQPVDLYSRVNRSVKYGFLFVGFTFLALLMFDVIGGVRVSPVEYLLMGAALVLFFVLLLALAEVIGFAAAYVVAAGAIAGLNTAYGAAILKSWRRAYAIGGLLIGLYAVLYILLSLEAFSLLIGSLLLFVALAGVMYATRRIDWGRRSDPDAPAA
ncbi:cell envelope integrity protein CreD [Sphingomonas sp. GCM10030256]|uniref:cell envelope integrity protein CreD n=1 Tax=Sphingomonas sp. GCM10030256 TaxID=3273427 RepID=UPI0036165D20